MPSIFSKEDKERIKRQLLVEGKEMMIARGITKMNIEELAMNAGIAKGTFYHFFDSKQDFILQIIYTYQNDKLNQLQQLTINKKSKLTIEEALKWYKTLYLPQENPLFHLSQKDLNWIMSKIPKEQLFRPEVDIQIGQKILSMIDGIREDVDYRVLANFPKMMEFAIENKELMHQEVLEVNFELIIDCIIRYIRENS